MSKQINVHINNLNTQEMDMYEDMDNVQELEFQTQDVADYFNCIQEEIDDGFSVTDTNTKKEETMDEEATLNQEITPEIEAVIDDILITHAFEDLTKWHRTRDPMLINEIDREKLFAQALDIQERMAKGMILINEANNKVSEIWFSNKYAGLVWKCFSGGIKDQEYVSKILSHPGNKALVAWMKRRQDLWNHWFMLQKESKQILGDNGLWGEFYKLIEEPIEGRFLTSDPTEIDEQWGLSLTQQELCEELKDSHLAEMAEYEKDETDGSAFWKLDQWLEDRKIQRQEQMEADMASLDAMIDEMF